MSATRTEAPAEPARQPDHARGAEPGASLHGKRNMLVATYNIHRGLGSRPAGPFRPDRIARVVAEIRPDLIALQEAQHYLRPSAGMLDAEAIERDLGLRLLRVTGRPGEQGWRGNLVLVRRDAAILRPPVGLRLGGLEPRVGVMDEIDLGWGTFLLVAFHHSLGASLWC